MIFFFPYTLKLLAPIVITDIGGDPNSATTLRYITGSSLRGAVAGKLGDPQDDAQRQARFRQLITSGQVCYLNAYPLTSTQQRALPAPASLRLQKYVLRATDKDKAVDLSGYDTDEPWPDGQLIGLDTPFVYVAGEIQSVPVHCSSRVHHQQDRTKGRPTKERGALFIYESLDPGQSFLGYVAVDAPNEEAARDLASEIADLVGEELLLGRSKLSGYGGKAVFSIDLSNPREREYDGSQVWDTDLKKGDKFRVVLLSDYIGRDPLSGQIDPTSFVSRLLDTLDHRAEVINQQWRFARAGGFNRKARLPLPLTATLAAGSVINLEATADISLEILLNIEAQGLGERRPEGFGRFSFWRPSSKCIKHQFPVPPSPDEPSREALSKDEDALLKTIQRRLLFAELESGVLEYAHSCTKEIQSLPSRSLLGRLRVPLRGKPADALGTLADWMSECNKNKKEKNKRTCLAQPAVTQLRRCILNDKGKSTLYAWLQEMISEENDKMKDALGFENLKSTYYLISPDDVEKVLNDLSQELRVRLIDAVLGEIMRLAAQKGGA